jgi:2-methylcitrate dehydratase PrpD
MSFDENLSRRLCDQVAGWRYEDLPLAVVEQIKYFLVDTFGVIGGATAAPGIRELNARLGRWEKDGSATGLVARQRLTPPSAALANGAAAHALDYDDQHDPARVHTNCVMVPTLLATAEDKGGVAGKDFILAMAIGAELHARLGLACYNSLGWGWHPTMVFGSLAGAIAAGKLLGLDGEGLANALGMAYHQASGSAQSMRDGVLSKRLGAGFAARAAVLGAFLASDGLTGTRHTLEGSAGLFNLYERGKVNVDTLMGDLGSRWHTLDYSFKPYPCCRANHTAIGIGLACRRDGIQPDDIVSAQIGLGEYNWIAVGKNYDPARNEVVHAQFNVCYGFARALRDGKVDLAAYRKPDITDPGIVALTSRMTSFSDPKIAPDAIDPASVRLTLKSGEVKELYSDIIKGSPRDPMTRDELVGKFRSCLDHGLGAGRAAADRLAATIFELESVADTGAALVEAFPAPAAARARRTA